MSEVLLSESTASLEVIASEQSNPVIPSWFSEAVLLALFWKDSGLLEKLKMLVHVIRGRMGAYEVVDFVLLLLAYSVSSEPTLELFFEHLKSVGPALMAVWGREKVPHRSALSRFLRDIRSLPLEQLRALFEEDFQQKGVTASHCGGLYDREGTRFIIFDVDGKKKATRQRAVVNTVEYPEVHRRMDAVCAPGHTGRKRGEAVRTKTTVMQAHTNEWLGTFSSPGNGQAKQELVRACACSKSYLLSLQLEVKQGTVRLDGLYGTPGMIAPVQESGQHYIVRGKDYGLLLHPRVQEVLKAGIQARWTCADSNVEREVFDVGFIEDWKTEEVCLPTRVIVTRRTHIKGKRVKVGKLIDGYVYELFHSSHHARSFTACDLLSLYLGRGGFEKFLQDENVEQNPDRWCSRKPEGQEFWQIVNQLVWNHRLRLGLVCTPSCLRQTLWAEAIEVSDAKVENERKEDREKTTQPPSQSQEQLEAIETSLEKSFKDAGKEASYGPLQLASASVAGKGKFAGTDFSIEDAETLSCPAKKPLKATSIEEDKGIRRIFFRAQAEDCKKCELSNQCLSEKNKGRYGRQVSGTQERICEAGEEGPSRPRKKLEQNPWSVPKQLGPCERPELMVVPGGQDVIWEDLPGSVLRRSLPSLLSCQCVELEQLAPFVVAEDDALDLLTRAQRAHRRLPFWEREARNALPSSGVRWKVLLYGVPRAVSNYMKSLTSKDNQE